MSVSRIQPTAKEAKREFKPLEIMTSLLEKKEINEHHKGIHQPNS